MGSLVRRSVALMIAIAAIPCAIAMIVLLVQEIGPCWELYLAAGALQIGALKLVSWGIPYALSTPDALKGDAK